MKCKKCNTIPRKLSFPVLHTSLFWRNIADYPIIDQAKENLNTFYEESYVLDGE